MRKMMPVAMGAAAGLVVGWATPALAAPSLDDVLTWLGLLRDKTDALEVDLDTLRADQDAMAAMVAGLRADVDAAVVGGDELAAETLRWETYEFSMVGDSGHITALEGVGMPEVVNCMTFQHWRGYDAYWEPCGPDVRVWPDERLTLQRGDPGAEYRVGLGYRR
jgi:hypothetical protein